MPITDLSKFAGFRQDGAGGLELWRGDGGDFAALKLKNLVLTALMTESGVIGITAGPTRTQAGATPLTQSVNRIDTSTAPALGSSLGDGVALPLCVGGQPVTVINNTNNIIQIYGNGTDTVNGIAGATGVPIPPGDVAIFKSAVAGSWAFEAGVGSAGALSRFLSVPGIVAGTTRTQAGATPLVGEFNRVDTSTPPAVGTSLGDGVALAPAATGVDQVVVNNTNNIITVYGNGADTINGVAGPTGVPIPPGDVATFVAAGPGAWNFEAGVGAVGAFNSELAVDGITAAGTNQATATPLTVDLNRVATVALGTGVLLPPARKGMTPVVMQHGANVVQCYANGSDTIDDIAGATGVSLMLRSTVIFFCFADGAWYTSGLGSGYAPSGLPTVQPMDNVTASGTSQATATQLTGEINTVATVPPGTGVNLPASYPGLPVTVINNGVNPLLVYPFQGATDTINGIAATLGVVLLPNSIGSFECTAAGVWTYSATTPVQAGYNTNNATAGVTLPAAAISGSQSFVALNLTGALAAAATAQLPTVASLLAALHGAASNTSFVLRIINSSGGAFAWTVTTNTGWTLGGTMTIAQNTYRDFVVKFTALGAATLQSIGTGTWS